jgi:glycosyltransferase involved in cell wall biosynthesis
VHASARQAKPKDYLASGRIKGKAPCAFNPRKMRRSSIANAGTGASGNPIVSTWEFETLRQPLVAADALPGHGLRRPVRSEIAPSSSTPEVAMTSAPKPVLFFADRLPPLAGGMEVHAGAFIRHFGHHASYPLDAVITRDTAGRDCLIKGDTWIPLDLDALPDLLPRNPAIVFFNSGRWIEHLFRLRAMFPEALFVYRTGGNEILKAPLERTVIASHADRQRFWVESITDNIDVLVTNSAYTEQRLRDLGLRQHLFARCVGGVERVADLQPLPPRPVRPVLVCAARFVPYKNHKLLLETFAQVARAGHDFDLRLIGDGPLMAATQQLASHLGLDGHCSFVGLLSNSDTCREIALADAYVQFSVDYLTAVPGGNYTHSEGMGRSLLEAVTYGTYVVALRSGAIDEIVTPERGSLLQTAEPSVLAQQIGELLSSPLPRPPATDAYLWPRYFQHYMTLWEGIRANPACY